MTFPTKAIYKQILSDSLRVSNDPDQPELYNKEDLERSMDKIKGINFH
jgi:Cft2 family RNA processing exonuclease